MTTHRNKHRTSAVLAVLGGLLAGFAAVAPAAAIPPDGPGPDTPGTSSSVSPTTLEPCGTISYTVSGYPAGETLYIKIDDGIGYGDTSVQGSGVWATQAINSSGSASGSFQLPCDIAPGAHWLRMLASQYVNPGDPGAGVLGFTRRGGNDFTVVAAGSGAGTTGGGQAAPAAGQVVGSGSQQVAGSGGTLKIGSAYVAPTTTPEPPAASGDALPPAFGDKVSAALDGGTALVAVAADRAGEWVYVYAFSEPTGLGWQQVDEDGNVTVSTAALPAGEHRLAVMDEAGTLLGWTGIEIGEPEAEASSPAAEPAQAQTQAAPVVEESSGGVPVVGLVGGGVLVLAGAVVAWWLLRRKGGVATP